MKDNKSKVQTCGGKVMANVFWESEGILLVEFLYRGVKLHSEWYVQSWKKLKQGIRMFWLNKKISQIVFLPTIPIKHPPTSIFWPTAECTPSTLFCWRRRRDKTQPAWRTTTIQHRVSRYRHTAIHVKVESCVDNEIDFVKKYRQLCAGCIHDMYRLHYNCNCSFWERK
jgi:hypothetical protein